MLLLYEDGMRVIIHTANLIAKDWDLKTQGYVCTFSLNMFECISSEFGWAHCFHPYLVQLQSLALCLHHALPVGALIFKLIFLYVNLYTYALLC